jgi:hypothetical protein
MSWFDEAHEAQQGDGPSAVPSRSSDWPSDPNSSVELVADADDVWQDHPGSGAALVPERPTVAGSLEPNSRLSWAGAGFAVLAMVASVGAAAHFSTHDLLRAPTFLVALTCLVAVAVVGWRAGLRAAALTATVIALVTVGSLTWWWLPMVVAFAGVVASLVPDKED